MSLAVGSKLGPYEIVAPIGAGGMGEVYRAHDPKLKRDVALKVLPDAVAADPERLARFAREAQVLASLNHLNIAHVYGVEDRAMVMELVEGESPKGPMPFEEAWKIASQIADALEYAHEKGIIHRDLKPANIKIKPDGTVKVLDFGLAKVAEAQAESRTADSPTLTMAMTQAGLILGTAAYMAPEQARGKPVDKRADIWAFGVVLYELLTGDRLFKGDDVTDILASVVKDEPDWSRVPPNVRRMLQSCLQKDPKKRLRDIGDAWQLQEVPESLSVPPPAQQRWLWPGIAALLAVALLLVSLVHFRERPAVVRPVQFQLSPTDQAIIPLGSAFAVSPDGLHLAFAASGEDKVTRLWIRSLNSLEARPLPGGEMSATPPPMFWSPDSRYVVFQDEGKLKKIDTTGGPAQTLCDVAGFVVSGSWNRDGQIILGNNVAGRNGGALMRVPAAGGTCSPLTRLDPSRAERYHSFPAFLPDGRHFVYHRMSGATSGIFVGSLDAKPEEQSTKQLVATPNGGAYVPPSGSSNGQLLFMREGTLMAQSFDDRRLELSGEAVPVAEGLGTFLNFAFFSVSANGVLVYRTGPSQAVNQLSWLDRQGKRLGTVGDPGTYNSVTLSPDATRAAVTRPEGDIWLLDLARGVSNRFTFGRGRSESPVWSPDGTRIIFASDREGGVFNLYQKLASGAKEEELLLKSPDSKFPSSWSHEGRFLLYTAQDPKTGNDVWVLPLDAGGVKAAEPQPFVRTEFQERSARFSPDSHWVAYNSNESGRDEIYVRAFSPSSAGGLADGGKWMVSRGAVSGPAWASGGKELMYIATDFKVTAVEVNANPVFQPGSPRALFQWSGRLVTAGAFAADRQRLVGARLAGAGLVTTAGDFAADGRMLAPLPAGPGTPAPFTVVLNWPEALHK